MAGKQEQSEPTDAAAVALFAAVSELAAVIAPHLELAPKDEAEIGMPHATRLLEEMRTDAEEMQRGREALKRSLAAQKGALTRAKREAAAIETARRASEPRRFVPVEPLSAAELLELVDDAEAVELAFVGGGGLEIGGLAPREIAGEAWKVRADRLQLQVPDLTVHGPRPGEPPYQLAGYALIADGDVLALMARSDVLAIGPGTTFQLKDDVAF
jgi:hypothetical protein